MSIKVKHILTLKRGWGREEQTKQCGSSLLDLKLRIPLTSRLGRRVPVEDYVGNKVRVFWSECRL